MTDDKTLNASISSYSQATMQAWKTALEASADLVSTPINTNDKDQLDTLPIFAMIVVLNKHQTIEAHSIMNDWANAQSNTPAGWQVVNVDNHDQADNTLRQSVLNHIDLKEDRIADVNVFRYVLTPSSSEMLDGAMSDSKRTAIAHVLDEQLSQYFKNKVEEFDNHGFDCHILPISHLLQVHKVACFDMDSTLIEQEVIVELANATGIGEKVNEITESAMRGEIDFSESFAQRLRLLHGTYADVLDNISESLTLSAGAKTTLSMLNAMGYHTVLVSGGFTYFTKVIAGKLNIDEHHGNELQIEDGKVIGEAKLPIVDGERKAHLVKKIAKHLKVDMSEVICIGDGANDLSMMAQANLGFAYRAKPIVQAKADLAINSTGLEGVLYGLGYSELNTYNQD